MDPVTIPIQTNMTNTPFDLGSYFSNIVGAILTIAALAAFLYLVMAGVEWITAGSDKGKLEKIRDRITNAIIGLAIVAVSWAIFLILDNFFGLGIANGTSSNNNSAPQNGPSGGAAGYVCVVSPIICGDGTANPYYCQNSSYHAESNGSCTQGGITGTNCRCVHN